MVFFSLTSRKNAAGPKGQAFEASHEEAQVSGGTQTAGVFTKYFFHYQLLLEILLTLFPSYTLTVCVCVLFCEKRLKWVRVNRIERSSQSYASFCYEVCMNHSEVNVHDFLESMPILTVDIDRQPCFFWVYGYVGTSTVDMDRFFFGYEST